MWAGSFKWARSTSRAAPSFTSTPASPASSARIMVGKRIGYGKEVLAPHSLTMSMIGASLLWVGWFGFNAGSNLEANSTTALAFVNTMVATAAAALSWMIVEWIDQGQALGCSASSSGVVAGLVAVTPAAASRVSMGSIVLGLVVSPICFFFARRDQEARSATTTRSTSSASTASAASSARSRPACWSTRLGRRWHHRLYVEAG